MHEWINTPASTSFTHPSIALVAALTFSVYAGVNGFTVVLTRSEQSPRSILNVTRDSKCSRVGTTGLSRLTCQVRALCPFQATDLANILSGKIEARLSVIALLQGHVPRILLRRKFDKSVF